MGGKIDKMPSCVWEEKSYNRIVNDYMKGAAV